MPAQQVRCEMAEVGPEVGGQFPAVEARYVAQVEIDVHVCCCARRGPVAGDTAGSR
ncbi:hypothetical protein ACFFV7_12760 [Nonomuraea spiralis]|uniref:Uncharacterized protein n=1 Tax=Nonomuraea spiralis TaxID=46182 RepID=A0ABV5IC00_9ACTN|nr:hypothetical protein [Nonomuraea spiralis]